MASSQRRVSVGVSMPPDLLDELDEQVGDRKRSAFIREAVRAHLNGAENE